MLMCINGDWYEMHASIECDKENNKPNVNDDDIKTEAIDYSLDDVMSLKSEGHDYDSDKEEDNIFEHCAVSYQNHIEVSPLPVIVKAILKEESTKSNPRKPKSSPKNTTKKEPIKVEVKNEETTVPKKRKQVRVKASFLDHRPTSTCICDICNKTLGSFSSLRNHILNMHCVSERNGRVSCEECGQTFSTPGNLNSHKKIHLKCKAYVCTYCGRGFNQLHNLKEHANRHTGDKPYKCERCDKVFGRKTNLTAHTRVHTGEKPFKCNIEGCDRAYMFEIDLKRHKYSIHGIFTKKHICPICSKVYPENKLLKKHLESHSTGFT